LTELRFDPAAEEEELIAYLGDDYDRSRLQRHQAQLEEEAKAIGDEDAFYRSSRGYLYDLTAFAMSGTKLPYLRLITQHLPSGARLLDYGCGIGADGLILLEAGYRVEFADFDNPSAEYLRWRLARRGLDAKVHDIDAGVPGGFDLAYAFDVIEHLDDPIAFLGEIEARAERVMVNLLESEPDEPSLHRELPIPLLLERAASAPFTLIAYRLFHRRSHLLLYETEADRSRGDQLRARLRSAPARHRAARAAAALVAKRLSQ